MFDIATSNLGKRRSVLKGFCASARALAAGRTDPVVLTEQALSAARSIDSVFIARFEDRPLFEAAQSRDRWRRGFALSAWDGLPISWKDLIDVRGTATTAGSLTRDSLAVDDAWIVRQGMRAGLVAIGKTNLSEFAFSGLGVNPHFGTPAGPNALDGSVRVPGGSSAGAATAVRLGAGLGAIGTDTAGSIRIPAALQGLVGFRPSVGRYSSAGVFPLAPSFDTPGPIAHHVEDCIALDAILLGEPDRAIAPRAPSSVLIIAAVELFEADDLEAEVRVNAEELLARFAARGTHVTYRPVVALQAALDTLANIGWLGGVDAYVTHQETLRGAKRAKIDSRVVERLDQAGATSPEKVLAMQRRGRELAAAIRQELDGALLAFPTVPCVAPALNPLLTDDALFAATNLRVLRSCMATSFLGMPGLTLPSGFGAQGLPTSLCLSMPEGEDDKLLAAALALDIIR